MKKLFKSLCWLLVLGLVCAALIYRDAWQELSAPLKLGQVENFLIAPGDHSNFIITSLYEKGLLTSWRTPYYLRLYARWTGVNRRLKTGDYELNPGLTAMGALQLFESGKVVLHELRVPEGSTFAELLQALAARPDVGQTLRGVAADRIMLLLDRKGVHPEGRFFPDTYRFARGATDLTVLRRALLSMETVLAEEWTARDESVSYAGTDTALIMASIVEKETGTESDRAAIASVFLNRLRLGMRLQTDPSVIYGLGEVFDGNLRRADLERDTPYNSYTRNGLPPTPICLPGRASIHAALHPASSRALYFVARGDGSSEFSGTLEQHNAAVRRYQLKRPHGKP